MGRIDFKAFMDAKRQAVIDGHVLQEVGLDEILMYRDAYTLSAIKAVYEFIKEKQPGYL